MIVLRRDELWTEQGALDVEILPFFPMFHQALPAGLQAPKPQGLGVDCWKPNEICLNKTKNQELVFPGLLTFPNQEF